MYSRTVSGFPVCRSTLGDCGGGLPTKKQTNTSHDSWSCYDEVRTSNHLKFKFDSYTEVTELSFLWKPIVFLFVSADSHFQFRPQCTLQFLSKLSTAVNVHVRPYCLRGREDHTFLLGIILNVRNILAV